MPYTAARLSTSVDSYVWTSAAACLAGQVTSVLLKIPFATQRTAVAAETAGSAKSDYDCTHVVLDRRAPTDGLSVRTYYMRIRGLGSHFLTHSHYGVDMEKERSHLLETAGDSPPQAAAHRSKRRSTFGKALLAVILLSCWTTYTLLRLRPATQAPLDSDLKAHCESILAPTEGYYASRLDRLVETLKEHKATWIAEPGPSANYYLGGFSKTDWRQSERPLLISVKWTGEVTILTPKFEQLRAQKLGRTKDIDVEWTAWAEDQSPYQVLVDALDSDITLVVDGQVRSFIAEGFIATKGVKMAPLELGKEISLIRERKDEREVGLLRCANQMTLHAIRETRKRMHLGITESKTRTILNEELARTGLEADGGLVLFGGDAALPHGSGTDKKLKREEMVLIDVGGTWGGYVADITRTFALHSSKIPAKHIEIWETVRRAQHAPYELLQKSNASSPPKFGDLDHAARQVINSKYSTEGFDIFTHRLGHGIGLEVHENPYLVRGAKNVPRAGHVFSLEPGIYVPSGEPKGGLDDVGVRLEDCFVVMEGEDGQLGGEWLSGPVGKWGDI